MNQTPSPAIEYADLGRIRLAYQSFGRPDRPAVFLIMGLGAQMIGWPDALCHSISESGYRVIRFDNRDIGQSTRFPDHHKSHLLSHILKQRLGLFARPPYTLYDMAKDCIGLLDHLKIATAHIVGASMGGMIAHIVAAQHYRRVRSLVSLMSSPGGVGFVPNGFRLVKPVLQKRQKDAERSPLDRKLAWVQALGYETSEHERQLIRDRLQVAMDRSSDDAEGTGRQIRAILGTGCQLGILREIRVPTLVIHGREDPLIPKQRGLLTARTIPNARLVLLPQMGHDLPSHLHQKVSALILDHIHRVDTGRKRNASQTA